MAIVCSGTTIEPEPKANCVNGVVLPIPTLPAEVMVNFSVPFVYKLAFCVL